MLVGYHTHAGTPHGCAPCCCRVTLELRDRQIKVDVLCAKFATLASRSHGTDADGGEAKSQAYYIVKVGILSAHAPPGPNQQQLENRIASALGACQQA